MSQQSFETSRKVTRLGPGILLCGKVNRCKEELYEVQGGTGVSLGAITSEKHLQVKNPLFVR